MRSSLLVFLLRLSRFLPGSRVHRYTGRLAYRARRWRIADREFTRALRGKSDRDLFMYAASTKERIKDSSGRDRLVTIGNEQFPSAEYDSSATFAVSTARPHERDMVGSWLAGQRDHIANIATDAVKSRSATNANSPTFAFVYWHSKDRPDVVQHCIDSMRRNLPDTLTLVELDAESLKEWITIDDRIMDAVDIPAHGADMIRLHLLATYGGLWLDSSCLLNPEFSEFFEKIQEQDLFLFTYKGSRTGNWFIWAKPGSYRLQLIKAALDTWFLSGRKWTNYFMFHDVVEMLYWTDGRYREAWDAGLHLAPTNAFDCHKALGHSVTDEEWRSVRRRSAVNKLSWRKYNAPELRADPTTGISRLMAEPISAP